MSKIQGFIRFSSTPSWQLALYKRGKFICEYPVKVVLLLSFVLSLSGSFSALAQLHPVQVSTQLLPPYSVYLSDYTSPGNEKLRLVVLQRDVTKPSYKIRLQLSVELNGKIILRTSSLFNPPPITLDAGIPTIISGSDLQLYTDSRNLDFIGISREEYERTKALPEGNYQICFTAFDYNRQDVQVSFPGCNFFWLSKSEPPLVNFPSCGTTIAYQQPQQIIFSWLPRNTASANSAAETEYEFSLYETRPAGRNPNDVVLTSQPVYRIVISNTQLVYGMTEPLLFENMTYVWRVRAIDKGGKDEFRNNGYSETCTFTYGGTVSNVQLEAVKDLQVEGLAERRGKATWTAQPVDGYKTHYKKVKGSNWYSQQSAEDSTSIFDLDPDTEYEVRVQAFVGATFGPYSEIKKFKTPKPPVFQCGDPAPAVPDSTTKLTFATAGMIINVQGVEMTLKEVEGPMGEGFFKGKGEVTVPYFSAVFNVVFDNLFIDDTRTATKGRIDFITKKVDDWVEDELEEQKKQKLAEQQKENREQWKDTEFYEKIFYYNDTTITDVSVNADGQVVVNSGDGKIYINNDIPAILKDAPEKAIIIEDKSGNQWVVQKDPATGKTKVTAAPGGGLFPNMNEKVSKEAFAVIPKSLTGLLINKYNKASMELFAEQIAGAMELLKEHASNNNSEIPGVDISGEDKIEPSNNTGQEREYSLHEAESDDEEFGLNDEMYSSLFSLAFEKLREYKIGEAINYFALPDNIEAAGKIIAPQLKIDNKTVTEFIEQQKALHTPDSEIVRLVGLAIETLLGSSITIKLKI